MASREDYLGRFHAERPGITERLLTRATDRGSTAYDWLLEAVPPAGAVLDLACGSAPPWPVLSGRAWIGVDRSAAELELAAARGAGPLLLASAGALPLRAESVDVVVCSMSLQVLTPLAVVLSEVARVLRPGGLLVATVPVNRPVSARDLLVLVPAMRALGQRITYPNDRAMDAAVFAGTGLRLTSDSRRRFAFPVADEVDARLWVESLYLPGLRSQEPVDAAVAAVVRRAPVRLPVPVRRLVAARRVQRSHAGSARGRGGG